MDPNQPTVPQTPQPAPAPQPVDNNPQVVTANSDGGIKGLVTNKIFLLILGLVVLIAVGLIVYSRSQSQTPTTGIVPTVNITTTPAPLSTFPTSSNSASTSASPTATPSASVSPSPSASSSASPH